MDYNVSCGPNASGLARLAPLGDSGHPTPILGLEQERRLTPRQRDLLHQLEAIFESGFANLTMADLAASLRCSLSTLYALAPSRDELVLVVVDRRLWQMGKAAQAAIRPEMKPMEALLTYLEATNMALSRWTAEFSNDLDTVPAARRLQAGHHQYLLTMITRLLDLAVRAGDIVCQDTRAVATMLAGMGRILTRPEVIPRLQTSPKQAADELVGIVIRGLLQPP